MTRPVHRAGGPRPRSGCVSAQHLRCDAARHWQSHCHLATVGTCWCMASGHWQSRCKHATCNEAVLSWAGACRCGIGRATAGAVQPRHARCSSTGPAGPVWQSQSVLRQDTLSVVQDLLRAYAWQSLATLGGHGAGHRPARRTVSCRHATAEPSLSYDSVHRALLRMVCADVLLQGHAMLSRPGSASASVRCGHAQACHGLHECLGRTDWLHQCSSTSCCDATRGWSAVLTQPERSECTCWCMASGHWQSRCWTDSSVLRCCTATSCNASVVCDLLAVRALLVRGHAVDLWQSRCSCSDTWLHLVHAEDVRTTGCASLTDDVLQRQSRC